MRFSFIHLVRAFGINSILAGAMAIALASGAHSAPVSSLPLSAVDRIFALHTFPEPLVPCGRQAPAAAENDALLACIAAFESRKNPDDLSALEGFLSAHPESPWHFAVQMNLGLLYYRAGYFSKCIPAYLAAWRAGCESTDRRAKALADRAAGEYTKMLARLGRYEDLKAFLPTVKDRDFVGQATELMMAGKEGSAVMEARPDISFRCGPMALSRILASQDSKLAAAPAIMESRSTMKGMSLTEVAAISRAVGLNYQPAKRASGAAVIVPSVVHWKVDHYAALVRKTGDHYLSEDPTFENHTWFSLEALEHEASGYFLVPPGPLPKGWTAVGPDEAATVFGKGVTTGPNPNETSTEAHQVPAQTCNKGMASYNFHTMLASLRISDTPVGYTPPYGPAVEFTATYCQCEASQPANFNYSNLGPKWNMNWLSYVDCRWQYDAFSFRYYIRSLAHAQTGGGTQILKQFEGGIFDPNAPPPPPAPASYNYPGSPGTKVYHGLYAPNRVEVIYADGAKDFHGIRNESNSFYRKFLTQRIDPSGNAVTLAYDDQSRITTITDALGQQTVFSYELPGDIYKITKVTDPFGRFATFSYVSVTRSPTVGGGS